MDQIKTLRYIWILTFELTRMEHKHTQGEEQSNLQEHGGLIGEVFQVLSCHWSKRSCAKVSDLRDAEKASSCG